MTRTIGGACAVLGTVLLLISFGRYFYGIERSVVSIYGDAGVAFGALGIFLLRPAAKPRGDSTGD